MYFYEWIAEDEDISPSLIEIVEYLKIIFGESEFNHIGDVILTKSSKDVSLTDFGVFRISKSHHDEEFAFDFSVIVCGSDRTFIVQTNEITRLKSMGYSSEDIREMSEKMIEFCHRYFFPIGAIKVLRPNGIDACIVVTVDENTNFFPKVKQVKGMEQKEQ